MSIPTVPNLYGSLRRRAAELGVRLTWVRSPYGAFAVPASEVALWDVRGHGRVLSDGRPQIDRKSQISATAPGATILIAGSAELKGCKITARGRECFVYIGPGAVLKNVAIDCKGLRGIAAIGAGTTWEGGACLVGGVDQHILIGDDAMIATDVMMRTDDGHAIFDLATRERINPDASVVVEEHVWIAREARIGKGARIGRGSIVGAGAFVSRRLDGNALYVGAPATKKRDNVAWSRTFAWEDIPEPHRRAPPRPEDEQKPSLLARMKARLLKPWAQH